MGRPFLIVVLALGVGMVLGAWQPRGELLESRAERDQLAREAKRCKRGAASAGITEMLRGAHRPGPTGDPEAHRRRATGERASGDALAGDVVVAAPEPPGGDDHLPALDDPEAMRAAVDARAAQTRAALIEADDVFAASIDDETRAGLDDATLDPFSYIDGSTLQALQRLEMAADE